MNWLSLQHANITEIIGVTFGFANTLSMVTVWQEHGSATDRLKALLTSRDYDSDAVTHLSNLWVRSTCPF